MYTAFGYDVSLGLKLIQLDVVVGLMSFGDTVGIPERYIEPKEMTASYHHNELTSGS